jgi:hypothetical protein
MFEFAATKIFVGTRPRANIIIYLVGYCTYGLSIKFKFWHALERSSYSDSFVLTQPQ